MEIVNLYTLKLDPTYYFNRDVIFLAKDLLGKVLFTQIDEDITAGIIVETEAYFGVKDKASHAYNGRRTNRTESLYHEGGISYVIIKGFVLFSLLKSIFIDHLKKKSPPHFRVEGFIIPGPDTAGCSTGFLQPFYREGDFIFARLLVASFMVLTT